MGGGDWVDVYDCWVDFGVGVVGDLCQYWQVQGFGFGCVYQ